MTKALALAAVVGSLLTGTVHAQVRLCPTTPQRVIGEYRSEGAEKLELDIQKRQRASKLDSLTEAIVRDHGAEIIVQAEKSLGFEFEFPCVKINTRAFFPRREYIYDSLGTVVKSTTRDRITGDYVNGFLEIAIRQGIRKEWYSVDNWGISYGPLYTPPPDLRQETDRIFYENDAKNAIREALIAYLVTQRRATNNAHTRQELVNTWTTSAIKKGLLARVRDSTVDTSDDYFLRAIENIGPDVERPDRYREASLHAALTPLVQKYGVSAVDYLIANPPTMTDLQEQGLQPEGLLRIRARIVAAHK